MVLAVLSLDYSCYDFNSGQFEFLVDLRGMGTGISSGLLNSGMMLKGFGFIGLAICLFECPSGDFLDTISLAFCSMSIPIREEMLSKPSKSSLIFLSEAEDIPPFESQVLE